MISRIEFYRARGLNTTLSIDPSFAYSSSNYDPGFNAAKAFDDDPTTMWMPSGWSAHNDNDDWIGYEFPIPVHIGSIKLMGAIKYPKAAPTKVYVEAANDKYGPFETKWMIRNPDFATERVFSFIGETCINTYDVCRDGSLGWGCRIVTDARVMKPRPFFTFSTVPS